MITLFQIPRPVDGDKSVFGSPENSMLASCQLLLRLLLLEILTSTSVCSPTKHADHLVVDETLMGRHSGSARETEGNRTPAFLSDWISTVWLMQSITGKEEVLGAKACAFLVSSLYSVKSFFQSNWTFICNTQFCDPSLLCSEWTEAQLLPAKGQWYLDTFFIKH